VRDRSLGIAWLSVLLVVAGSAAACSDSPVFGDTAINDTNWRVVSLAEEQLGSVDVTIGLDDPELGTATLSTPCRSIAVRFVFDSDSEGVSFGDPGSADESCTTSLRTIDQRAAAALAAAESWHLVDDKTIEMRNADGGGLLQMTLISAGS
jgi:META domain